MTRVSREKVIDHGSYLEEQITVDNTPDIGDKTGVKFLDNLDQAIAECRKLIAEGYRLTDYWTDHDVGMIFNLKKKK